MGVVQTGSRRWFAYIADNGTEYAIELDESIYETPELGFGQLTGQADALSANSSRPLKMRYVNAVRVNAQDETERASFFVGTQAAYAALQAAGSINVGGISWGLSSVRGESRKLIPLTDTEALDGDVDANIAAGV